MNRCRIHMRFQKYGSASTLFVWSAWPDSLLRSWAPYSGMLGSAVSGAGSLDRALLDYAYSTRSD
ncbi:hypothetical protein [Silvibacterium acidisoli]|uniref:hypothetical protein n=1 Tax=Acidobacteriaceae bacterium ZG23-2 TaxID=2883246 RepID=UPI00406BED20